jgi:hypothetical protein
MADTEFVRWLLMPYKEQDHHDSDEKNEDRSLYAKLS